MQVTETLSQGLKRAYKVVLPAGDLADRLNGQLVDMQGKARINGFRPGKVPMGHLRKLYGKSVMADVVQNAVNEVNKKILDDHGLRLAGEPKINFPEDKAEVEKALAAAGVERQQIGALVHGSVCRDFLEPATACGVHHGLGLPDRCAVYDVSNACLGLLNGMESLRRWTPTQRDEVDGLAGQIITRRELRPLRTEGAPVGYLYG